MTWCLIQMIRSVLGKLRPALSGKEINGNRKIVKGDKVPQDRHLQLLFRILVLILLLILGVIFVPSTGYLQDHVRHTSVLGVANRDTGEATAPRSSSSRQQNDSDEINDKYLSNFDIFETEQSVFFNMKFQNNLQVLKVDLKNIFQFFREIECNSFALDVIENDYSIPFVSTPCLEIITSLHLIIQIL